MSFVTLTRTSFHRGRPRTSAAGNLVTACGTHLIQAGWIVLGEKTFERQRAHAWARPCSRCFSNGLAPDEDARTPEQDAPPVIGQWASQIEVAEAAESLAVRTDQIVAVSEAPEGTLVFWTPHEPDGLVLTALLTRDADGILRQQTPAREAVGFWDTLSGDLGECG